MQAYQRKERRPGRPLWGNWLFEDLSPDVREFLVEDCQSLRARAYLESGSTRFQIVFFDHQGKPFHYIDDGGIRPLGDRWAHVCQALDHWQHAVMTTRARPDGYEVIVVPKWERMRPPTEHLEEIATVEVGPRIGGPQIPSAIR
jgi:hypothetical protein